MVQHKMYSVPHKASSVPHRMDVNVEFYSPSIVRVYKTPSQKSCNKESLVIVKTPESTPVSFGEKGKNVTLSSRLIQVEVNPETGGIHFSIRPGNVC